MQRIILQVPMSKELKEKAEAASFDLGFSSLQETVRILLTKLSKKELDIKVEEVEKIHYLSPKAEKKFKRAQEDIRKGKVSPSFDSIDEAIAWLNDPKAKYQNGDKV